MAGRWKTASLALCASVALGGVFAGCGDDDETTAAAPQPGAATSAVDGDATAALQEAEASWETGTPPARKAAFAAADNGKKVSIAYFASAAANPFWAKTLAAVQEVAKVRNASVKVFDAAFDPAKQQSQMQDAITSGRYDAFIVIPVANTNLIPVVAQAKARGIPVVATGDFPLGPKFDTVEPQVPGVVGVAMTSPQAIAAAIAQGAVEACKLANPCRLAQISGGFKLPVEANIWKLLEAEVGKVPGAKIVAREEGQYLVDPARTAMQDILTAHPDVNVISTTSDAMAAGAETAIKQAGKLDQIKLNGDAGSAEGVKAVRDGRWFMTAVQLPYDNGLYAADIALRAARDQEIADTSVDVIERSGMEMVATKAVFDELPDFTGQWKNG